MPLLTWSGRSMLNAYDYRIFLVGFFSSVIGVLFGWATWDRGLTIGRQPTFPSKQHVSTGQR